jgi:hypothetical protein
VTRRAFTAAATPVAVLLAALTFALPDAPSQAQRETLSWRQAEILHVRARTYACTDALGRPRFRVAQRVIVGGPAYRRWVLEKWRARERLYCNAARALRASPTAAICLVFGDECAKALRVARCESNLYVYARSSDGLYWGLFQQGSYSRSTYGFGWSALEQARASKRHRDAEGWGPWPVCGRL